MGFFDVPGPGFGEVVIAGMREDVDLISTLYRVDQARALVQATTTAGYVNVRTLGGVGDPAYMQRNTNGVLITETRTLGKAETETSFGSPTIATYGVGQDLLGIVLDFKHDRRALVLSEINPNPNQGVLVTAVVNLPELDTIAEGASQNIVASTELAGFAVQLAHLTAGPTVLRFMVRVGAAYYYHDYPVTGGNPVACSAGSSGVFTAALNGGDSYVLTAHYTGAGAAYLFINHQCAGAAPAAVTGGIEPSSAPTLIGADPRPSGTPNSLSHYRGHIQQAQVQLWGPHAAQETN